MLVWTIRKARKVIIAVVGVTVLTLGIDMIFLPGPASIVTPVGLGILATEFIWAKRLLRYVRGQIDRVWPRWRK